MSKLVFVNNIPVRTCVDGWVEIPDETEDLHDAIENALRQGRYRLNPNEDVELEVDEPLLQKWEFNTPLEPT